MDAAELPPYGVFIDDGDRAQCHECGRFFGHLGAHVRRGHGMSADSYREVHGLKATQGLIGPTLRRKRADFAAVVSILNLEPYKGANAKYLPSLPRVVSPQERQERRASGTFNCRFCGRETWAKAGSPDKRRHLSCGRAECVAAARVAALTPEVRDRISASRHAWFIQEGYATSVSTGICVICGEEFAQRRLGRRYFNDRVTCSDACDGERRARLKRGTTLSEEARRKIGAKNRARPQPRNASTGRFVSKGSDGRR